MSTPKRPRGRPIERLPDGGGVTMTIRVSEKIRDDFRAWAIRNRYTLRQCVETAFVDFMTNSDALANRAPTAKG